MVVPLEINLIYNYIQIFVSVHVLQIIGTYLININFNNDKWSRENNIKCC